MTAYIQADYVITRHLIFFHNNKKGNEQRHIYT